MWSGVEVVSLDVGVASELCHWILESAVFWAFTNIKWNSWKCVSIRSEK